MRVLWLVSWFPHPTNPFDGDFIERHARAAALKDPTDVIFVVKLPATPSGKTEVEIRDYAPGFRAFIYMYPARKGWGKLVEIAHSSLQYLRLHWRAYRSYKKLSGVPAGILVQVGLKAGLPAVLWKLLDRVPYVLFERWGGILPEATPNYRDLSLVKRWLWKFVYRQANHLVTVTRYFGEAVLQQFGPKPLTVIPNGVDGTVFYPGKPVPGTTFRFIHVSTLDANKNLGDILKAVQLVRDRGQSLELLVFGPASEMHHRQAASLQLSSLVTFRGEVPHQVLADEMRQCHALILYSHQETFGNVLIEANACGLPVIVSQLKVFEEIVEDGVNGLYAKGANPQALAEKMVWLMENHQAFDAQAIRERTLERYHPAVVAELFDQLYRRAFTGNR